MSVINFSCEADGINWCKVYSYCMLPNIWQPWH